MFKRFKEQRASNKPFPVVWLSYANRVRSDVETAYATPGGPEFFDQNYERSLAEAARTLEDWQIKLSALQFVLYCFAIVGYVSPQPSIDIMGLSVKDAPGLKELTLFLVSTLTLFMFVVSASKDLRIVVLEKLRVLRCDPAFRDLALIAAPASFYARVYVAKSFHRFAFPLLPTRLLTGAVILLAIIISIFLYVLSIFLQVYLMVEIYRHPTLGTMSIAAFWYVIFVSILGLFWLVRFFVPLPYRDKHLLKELESLRKTDPAEYLRRASQIWPRRDLS